MVEVYLQKASLKAAGLISSEKAMVVSREDHLRWKRGRTEAKAAEKKTSTQERKGRKREEETEINEERNWTSIVDSESAL